jgi:hypothetical protein
LQVDDVQTGGLFEYGVLVEAFFGGFVDDGEVGDVGGGGEDVGVGLLGWVGGMG